MTRIEKAEAYRKKMAVTGIAKIEFTYDKEIDGVYLTDIHTDHDCDIIIPEFVTDIADKAGTHIRSNAGSTIIDTELKHAKSLSHIFMGSNFGKQIEFKRKIHCIKTLDYAFDRRSIDSIKGMDMVQTSDCEIFEAAYGSVYKSRDADIEVDIRSAVNIKAIFIDTVCSTLKLIGDGSSNIVYAESAFMDLKAEHLKLEDVVLYSSNGVKHMFVNTEIKLLDLSRFTILRTGKPRNMFLYSKISEIMYPEDKKTEEVTA